ncbi:MULTISPECIES: beta family protein [Pseudomonas]|uniref:beta family protein n=1 Tax=Pseudomonas cichorii TaxID=36746 RepID=UPI001910011C|nr:beta family protein [Pseudomonas cichorii]GFM67529.1 hypothetical protein PSCICJ_36470 [Pseudomonas cichorii]
MIKYVPFLKFKQNEIQGVGVLDDGIRNQIVPLYDVPRSEIVMTEKEVLERLRIADKNLKSGRKKSISYKFFVDNFDIDDSINLDGVPQYRAILHYLSDYTIIPVLAFDRHPDHNVAALEFVKARPGAEVGIRLQMLDLDSYSLTKSNLEALWVDLAAAKPQSVVLLLDLRIIEETVQAKKKIERFLAGFQMDFQVTAIVMSGSIVPASISGLVKTGKEVSVDRKEYMLWRSINASPAYSNVLFGDYGIISPEYSDVDIAPELISGRSAPKVFYTYHEKFFIARGKRFKTHKHRQYFDISDSLVDQVFFRDPTYSYGERYIHDRSSKAAIRAKSTGSPGSWIKTSTAAHITFVVNNI